MSGQAHSAWLMFGGPYSNLAATRAMRSRAEVLGIPPSRTVCTGDIVAYCAEPAETASLIRDWGCHVVRGNCEESLARGAPDCGCNFEDGTACDLLARGWYPHAVEHVPRDLKDWMGTLPPSLDLDIAGVKVRVIHGGGEETARWVFASTPGRIDEELARAGGSLIIAGHCGLPFIARRRLGVWFNPGVIGMPANDGTPDGWYGLVTPVPDGIKLSTHRLAYDAPASAATLRRLGHANGYARSLITGLWPSLDVLPDAERAATGQRLRTRSLTLRAAGA